MCLAGAYTGRLIDPDGDFALSPGDLDEAVQVLLVDDWAAATTAATSRPASTASTGSSSSAQAY